MFKLEKKSHEEEQLRVCGGRSCQTGAPDLPLSVGGAEKLWSFRRNKSNEEPGSLEPGQWCVRVRVRVELGQDVGVESDDVRTFAAFSPCSCAGPLPVAVCAFCGSSGWGVAADPGPDVQLELGGRNRDV